MSTTCRIRRSPGRHPGSIQVGPRHALEAVPASKSWAMMTIHSHQKTDRLAAKKLGNLRKLLRPHVHQRGDRACHRAQPQTRSRTRLLQRPRHVPLRRARLSARVSVTRISAPRIFTFSVGTVLAICRSNAHCENFGAGGGSPANRFSTRPARKSANGPICSRMLASSKASM